MNIKEFLFDIGPYKTDKLDIVITERFREKGHKYRYICNKCSYEGVKSEYDLEKDSACPGCINQVVVKGFNDIPTTDPWMVPYFQGGEEEASKYTKSSGKKIIPICPHCGRVKEKSMTINNLYKIKSIGCSCGDGVSNPNKFIFALMEELLRTNQLCFFRKEYQIQNKKYDIIFLTKDGDRYAVEMDGGINHGHVLAAHPVNGQKFRKVSCKLFINDMEKDKIASENHCEIIRIDCYRSDYEYIKTNVLKSKLGEIFNLENVNWDNVLEFYCSSLIKKVCDYKREHPEAFVNECAKAFNLSDTTTREYLKYGERLGWCDYNPKGETKRKAVGKDYYYNAISIIIENQDTKEKIRIKSESEFERQSKELLGEKITRGRIHTLLSKNDSVIIGNYKIYKENKGD